MAVITVSLDDELKAEAQRHGVNLSASARAGIEAEVARRRAAAIDDALIEGYARVPPTDDEDDLAAWRSENPPEPTDDVEWEADWPE